MGDNIQTNITRRLKPCMQKKIDKTAYLVDNVIKINIYPIKLKIF